jgi:hypothetical protein
MFAHELMYFPESMLKEHYSNMIQNTHFSKGGHFAAFEEPQLLADDVWSFVSKVEKQIIEEERLKKQSKTAS